MIRTILFLLLLLTAHAQEKPASPRPPLEKSAYFAFVDRDYIFTIEVADPGVLLLNFVSMTNTPMKLVARDIRIGLQNRKTAVKLLSVETGDFNQPMRIGWLNILPRSSFGLRLTGDFGDAKEIYSAVLRLGDEDFTLAPLTSFDFEFLAARINRINLGSPDFSEDWRVLQFQKLGSRSSVRRFGRDREITN
ncbi:MAG: hypothetical protein QUT30_03360 [Acidobacteriota bacterium]|nr:hypothetical protein [Acidobacteriota bacterium]